MQVIARRSLLGAVAIFCAVTAFAAPQLSVSAESAVIMDAQSGKVLWAKDEHTPRFPASTTKIMTAMLLIERCRPEEIVTAPPGVDKVEGASLHLVPGEMLSARDLLYGILLRSANDGCVAAAVHISGSVSAFCQLMNERAKELGCKDTHFDNPNGLNDDNHTISAYDLGLVARAAMRYPDFRNIVCIRKHVIQRSINVHDCVLVSKDRYLDEDPTADGIKTGWTRPAGHCFVGSATRNGYQLITVILHSDDWKKDNAAMFNWAFENHDRQLMVKAGTVLQDVKVTGGSAPDVPVTVSEDIYHVYDRAHPCEASMAYDIDKNLQAPVEEGQPVGYLVVSDNEGWQERLPLIAEKSNPRAASLMGMGILPMFFFVGLVGSGALFVKVKLRAVRRPRRRPA